MNYSLCLVFWLFIITELSCQSSLLTDFRLLKSSTALTSVSIIEQTENPANIIRCNDFISANYLPSRFGIKELSVASGTIRKGLSDDLSLLGRIAAVGNELYSEYSFGIAISHSFSDIFAFGIATDFSRISINNWSNTDMVRVDIGAKINISEMLIAGFLFKNLTRDYYKPGRYLPCQNVVAGLGYRFDEQFTLTFDSDIRLNRSFGIAITGSYSPIENIKLFSGFLTEPEVFDLGFAARYSDWLEISFSMSYCSKLGYSINPEINYYF